MLTKGLNKIELAPEAAPRSVRAGRVAGSLKYDWLMAVLIFWLIGGVHVDGWAHSHIPGLETFFTPWHAIFYTGLLAIGSFSVQPLLAITCGVMPGQRPSRQGTVFRWPGWWFLPSAALPIWSGIPSSVSR